MKCVKNMKTLGNVIKNKLGIKFHIDPIYEKKYLKAKVKKS